MKLAGTPPAIVLAGTSLSTTAPAATTAFSPTITPGNMLAAPPIQAFRLISIGLQISARLSMGSEGWFSVMRLTFGPIKTLSSIVIPPMSRKLQAWFNNSAKIGVERGEYGRGLIERLSRDLTQPFPNLVHISSAIEFG